MALDAGIGETRFWDMQPWQITDRYTVWCRHQEHEMERAAWMVHYIMTAMVGSKNAPDIDTLLGRKTDA